MQTIEDCFFYIIARNALKQIKEIKRKVWGRRLIVHLHISSPRLGWLEVTSRSLFPSLTVTLGHIKNRSTRKTIVTDEASPWNNTHLTLNRRSAMFVCNIAWNCPIITHIELCLERFSRVKVVLTRRHFICIWENSNWGKWTETKELE